MFSLPGFVVSVLMDALPLPPKINGQQNTFFSLTKVKVKVDIKLNIYLKSKISM